MALCASNVILSFPKVIWSSGSSFHTRSRKKAAKMMKTMNGKEVLMFPLPFKRRDLVQYEGQEYQILKHMGETADRFSYDARNTETFEVTRIKIHYDFEDEDREPPKEEDNYFQILELNEDGKDVTLKSFSTGNERKMKVRWEEDVDFIRDGLLKEDQELFCTLGKFMGKEMIGDFKFMPKDPQIMKMPDLVMDTIFSFLTPEDRIQCRLVTSRWAHLLPIKKFVKCTSLNLSEERQGNAARVRACFRRLKVQKNPVDGDKEDDTRIKEVTVFMKDLYPLVNASVLGNVEYLYIAVGASSLPSDILQVIFDHCHKIQIFSIKGNSMDEVHASNSDRSWVKKIISSNIKHLETLYIRTAGIGELDLLNDIQIGDATSLQSFRIDLSPRMTLQNLESLPPSVTALTLRNLSVPVKKSQIHWISANLPKLTEVNLDVHHNHVNMVNNDGGVEADEDEVDETTIRKLLADLPLLNEANLYLGLPSSDRGRRTLCGNGMELASRLNQNVGQTWYIDLEDFCGQEILNIRKIGDDAERFGDFQLAVLLN